MYIVDRIPREATAPVEAVPLSRPRRTLDIVVAVTSLLVLAPLLGLLGVLVWATGARPALLRQRRTGEGGRQFVLYKFRTMTNGSTGPEVAGRLDPRVTRVGRVLRRLHLDELPQLWNVLRGDMTLAGPRPEVPCLARRYAPEHQWVFLHRPGLTGPCQLRSRAYAARLDGRPDPEEYYLSVLVPERVALDAEFLRRPSLPRVVGLSARTAWYLLSAVFGGGSS
jgi:lipopolysaccharide/colanic/teichoic acid biosynthesis glycosyltransferase